MVTPSIKKKVLKKKTANKPKSGLKILSPSQVLFNDGDHSTSLYIIQKGQLRLYKPKGKGFIELATLRAGEVIGEMAYFGENDNDKRRSCSAMAIVPTEVIEISFVAFGKTMANLNPWFKTIINTLASRLRKTNAKVRELESNSVSSYGQSASGYEYIKMHEFVRIITMVYFVSSVEEKTGQDIYVHQSSILHYLVDVYGLPDGKIDDVMQILIKLGLAEQFLTDTGKVSKYKIKNLDALRTLSSFINSQRMQPANKQLMISHRCELLLKSLMDQVFEKGGADNAAKEKVSITKAIIDLQEKGKFTSVEDLDDAKKYSFITEPLVDETSEVTTLLNFERVSKSFVGIRTLNLIKELNESRSKN